MVLLLHAAMIPDKEGSGGRASASTGNDYSEKRQKLKAMMGANSSTNLEGDLSPSPLFPLKVCKSEP